MPALMLSGPALLPEGRIAEATVCVEGERITRITPGADPAADLRAEGVIAPGFIDLQINGGWGHDFSTDGRAAAAVAARLPATGVTAFLPTVITSPPWAYPHRLTELAEAGREVAGAG